ncbi:Response regulator receiver domain-containing protein [Rhizobium sp. NFR07]|uniref:response regulator n=1 Tax=Rhizobium sp. NFR07 TaxID=1566262 RepID=UPI0008E22A6E|nr:response regulator [Rhizobium sp. NFR07]SFB56202.1 Response regulator receiver domain-containing protein [Rhizobium sp. NFR07]
MAVSTTGPLLIVEDDGLIRMDLADTLQDAGYAVLEAANADEAWAILLETDVSALITDIDMPGSMDGLELARRVCDRWPDCQIIVISGRYNPEASTLPPDAIFLTKPVGETELFKALEARGLAV